MAELCAPGVASETLSRIASVESSYNPLAIGVVGGRLQRQPLNLPEALATVSMLETQGYDYSLGIVQVNQKNFGKYSLTPEAAFDPCANLRVGSLIFQDCYQRAGEGAARTSDALSCYYSGNFTSGYRLGYVAKVQAAGAPNLGTLPVQAIPVVARSRPVKARVVAKPQRSAPEPLFVTASSPSAVSVKSAGDLTKPTASKETALLF